MFDRLRAWIRSYDQVPVLPQLQPHQAHVAINYFHNGPKAVPVYFPDVTDNAFMAPVVMKTYPSGSKPAGSLPQATIVDGAPGISQSAAGTGGY